MATDQIAFGRSRRKTFLQRTGIVLPSIAILVCIMAVVEPRFFSRANIVNILREFSVISIVSLGQAMVMIVGGFDLSVGAAVALSSIISATSMGLASAIWPDSVAIICLAGAAAGLLSGVAVGLANGLIVARLRLDSFVVTIGTSFFIVGLVYYLTHGIPVYGVPPIFIDIGRRTVLALPLIFWICAALVAIAWLALNQTAMGRHIYATGGNPEAAESAGINTVRVVVVAFTISGALAALVGLYYTARIGSGQSALGATMAMQTIAAAVIGGVSLRGGSGNILNVALGGLFLALMANALNLARIDSKFQVLVFGLVLVAAAIVDRYANREDT